MRPPKFKIIEVYIDSHDGCSVQRMARMMLAITTPGRRWIMNKKMDELVIYEGGPSTLEWTKNDERRLWDAVARHMAIDVY